MENVRTVQTAQMTSPRTVTTIPATRDINTSTPLDAKVRRKVAGYARVSTGNEDQVNSYEAQVDYYTTYIKNRNDWEFVNVYTDDGITGTSTVKREGFNTMVADALAGKIEIFLRTLIQCPSHGSVEDGLKQRLSADLSVLPKAFFFYALK